MHHKPIIIIPGQSNSVFFEIFFKTLKRNKFFSALILICDANVFKINAKKYNFNGLYNLIQPDQKINLLKKKQ